VTFLIYRRLRCDRRGERLPILLNVPEPGVQHLFDTVKLRPPQLPQIVKPRVKVRHKVVKPRVEVRYDDSDQHNIEQHRDADGEIELLVGHHL
jgi:hypothetical protein